MSVRHLIPALVLAASLPLLTATGAAGSADLLPSGGPPHPIGSYANGCIGGAAPLPPDGPGYQAVNLSRRRTFGHPELVAYVQVLAAQVVTERLGLLLVGDLAGARGGRLPGMHASHQTGLDVDLWFDLSQPRLPAAARERDDFPSMVDGTTRRVDPRRFGPAQIALLKLAATDTRVARIFVNPAIKLALCEQVNGDRRWLHKIRPWFGHAAHFHVRLDCPRDAVDCVRQDPVPAGEGCDAELMSWFEPPKPQTTPPRPVEPPPPPAACRALLGLPG